MLNEKHFQGKISHLLIYSIILILSILSYGPCINGSFVFDDEEAVINNNDVKLDNSWTNCFYNDFWGTRLSHPSSHKSYRPLTILSYRLNVWLDGELKAKSFHIINLGLHIVFCLLLFHVYKVIFDYPWAFLATLLFTVHPVHTEAVCAIVGRADLLGSIFVIISFLFYVKCITSENFFTSQLLLVLSLISTTLAVFCKEQGITALGLCCVYDVLYNFYSRNEINSPIAPKICSKISSSTKFLSRQLCLLVAGLCLLYTRFRVMGGALPNFKKVDNPSAFLESFVWRGINHQYIYFLNIWIFIHPIWLCFDWSMGCVPIIQSVLDYRILFVLGFWILATRTVYLIFRNGKTRNCIVGLAVSFIVIPFIPASNIFFTVGFVLAERILYLPSIGYCLIVITGFRELLDAHKLRCSKLLLVLVIVIYALRSYQRSLDWTTEEKLFKSGLQVCPLNAKVHYNIAKNAADNGNVNLAVKHYKMAINLNPEYDQSMNNLANILKDQGQIDEAKQLLEKAVNLRPEFAAAWMNLGIVEATMKNFGKAEACYMTALKHRSRYPDCFYNLGNLYLEQKLHQKAYVAWKNATNINPFHTAAWTNMIIMLDSIGDLEKAVDTGMKALQHLPDEPILHFNVANALGKLGRYPLSEKHFLVAIKYQPENSSYHANLGVLYHRWKKYSQAEKCYRNALKYDPSHKSASENLHLVLKQKLQ